MTAAFTALALATALVWSASVTAAHAASPYEAEPVLEASKLAPSELLSGPQFRVDQRVPVKDFLERFTLRSNFGNFDVHGLHMLYVRVREVDAIGQLDQMSKTGEFAEAAARAVARPLTSAANMAMNPVETVAGLPGGVMRLFDRIEQGGQAVVAAATASDATDAERVESVTKRVGGITVTALGYEKERRDLARGLGVDPYTTNPVLAKKLDDMAWVAFSGRMGIQAAMSVLVPYSMAMSAVTITNSTVYDTPAGDLVNNARAIFGGTGATDAQVTALVKNPQYSLSLLTDLAMGVQRLQGVNGLDSLVQFGAIARTQDETRFVAAAANMLARHHERVGRLATVTAPGPILARTVSGTLVVPAPIDYVAWTERIARFADRADLRTPRRLAWLSGQFSPRARKEFEARGWTVFESFTVAAER